MQKQTERNFIWLFAGICCISALAWLTNSYTPSEWSIFVFFLMVFTTSGTFAFFLLNNLRRAILIGVGMCGFFFLRFIQLREPLYLMLLMACLVSLELYLVKR